MALGFTLDKTQVYQQLGNKEVHNDKIYLLFIYTINGLQDVNT